MVYLTVQLQTVWFHTVRLQTVQLQTLQLNDRKPIRRKYIYIVDQVQGQDGWILAKFSFCVFTGQNKVEVHKHENREQGQYPAILTKLAKGFIVRFHTLMSVCVFTFFFIAKCILEIHQHFCFLCFILVDAFGFLVSRFSRQENSRAPAWT